MVNSRRTSPARRSRGPSPVRRSRAASVASRPRSPVTRPRSASPRRGTRSRTPENLIGLDEIYDRITAATNRLTDHSIEAFDGTKSSDIDDWLRRYENLAVARRWDDIAKKEQLPTFFIGSAGRWLQYRQEMHSRTSSSDASVHDLPWSRLNWTQVKTMLRQHYLPDDYYEYLRTKLSEPQRRGQDLVSFFDDKVYIAGKLNRTPGETIRAIKRSLLPEYKSLIGVYAAYDLDDFLERLKEAEILLRSDERRRQPERTSLRDVTQPPQSPRGSQTRQSEATPRRCYNCQEIGHISRNCRAPQYIRDQRRNFQAPYNPRNQPRSPNYAYNQQNSSSQRPSPSGHANGQRNQGYGNYYDNRQSPSLPYQGLPSIAPPPNQGGSRPGGAQRVQQLRLNESVPEYKLDVKVNGIPTEGLLDTGASVTCLDYDYFNRKFGGHVDLLAPEDLVVRGVGGIVDTKGIAKLTYQYIDKDGDEQSIELPTLIMADSGSSLIIGRDFIGAVNLQLDTSELKIYCDKPNSRRVNAGPPKLVYGKRRTEVPGQSTTMMAVYVSSTPVNQHSGNLTPTPSSELGVISNLNTNETRVMVANSLVELKDDTIIPVTNFSSEKCVISQDTPIAKFEDCVIEADDGSDESTNPYVFKEQLEGLELSQGLVSVGQGLSRSDQEKLSNLLEEFIDLFAFNGRIGDCTVLEHDIKTGDARPVYSAPYRQSHRVREAIQKQVEEWLRDGVIRPSCSPWASPIVIVPKKDKTMRMCIDLRGVNKVTERDVYPLPCIEDIFASLNQTMYFSSLDLNQGYMQIRMASEAIPKTAFITQDGLYEFTRMPFGLTNAPATFQRCMDIVLSGLKWNQCLVYLDDIIIFGRTIDEHHKNLVNVLARIREANLTIKPSKCAFCVTELRFLGHVVSGKGIRMDPDKVTAIRDLPAPTNVTEIRSFIGAASYYRRFVESFSKIAEPLSRLTKDKVKFSWTQEQQDAFEEIKKRLVTQPVLCHYDPNLPLELRTDACGYGLGAILLHVFKDGSKHVIAYASRLMNKAERNYAISEQECLAIVWAIDKFKIYLQCTKFKVVTDHIALTWLNTKKQLAGRLMRWALALQQYDFEIEYKSGRTHKDVDHLSRYPCQSIDILMARHWGTPRRHPVTEERITDESRQPSQDSSLAVTTTTSPTLTLEELISAQRNDEKLAQIISH